MTQVKHARDQERIASATGVALLHAALGYALLTGLGFDLADRVEDDLKLFDVREKPPPPPAEPPQTRRSTPPPAASSNSASATGPPATRAGKPCRTM